MHLAEPGPHMPTAPTSALPSVSAALPAPQPRGPRLTRRGLPLEQAECGAVGAQHLSFTPWDGEDGAGREDETHPGLRCAQTRACQAVPEVALARKAAAYTRYSLGLWLNRLPWLPLASSSPGGCTAGLI